MKRISGIMFYCNYCAPYGGNFMRSILKLTERIKKDNNANIVFAFPKEAENRIWIKDVEQISDDILFTNMDSFLEGIRLRRVIEKHQVTIFYAHFVWSKFFYYANLGLIMKRNVRVYVHVHNQCIKENTLFVKLYRHLIFYKKHFIGCSKSVSEGIKLCGYKPQLVHTIMNAIDFSRLDIVHEELNLSNLDGFKCMIFGGFPKIKGVDLAVRAIDNIRSTTGENIILLIPVSRNSEYTKQFILDDFGKIPSWCYILPPIEDIGSYYNLIDVFLAPSREEGFGYAVVEAYYFEKQVIASKIPGQKEISLSNIKWFEPENITDLSNKIYQSIIADKKVIGQRQEAIDKYGINRWIDEMVQLFTT